MNLLRSGVFRSTVAACMQATISGVRTRQHTADHLIAGLARRGVLLTPTHAPRRLSRHLRVSAPDVDPAAEWRSRGKVAHALHTHQRSTEIGDVFTSCDTIRCIVGLS